MANALVLGGGAPNLTMMSGAVAALHEAGVRFDVVSTSGAGMLIGLLYAAPRGMTPSEALKNSVNMGVHDAIYDVFPVNYKVFHKPGPMAQAYTRFWQTAAAHRGEMDRLTRQWTDSALEAMLPGAALAPYRSMWKQLWGAMPAAGKPNEDAQRFFNDLGALMLATFCPSDLSAASQGMCEPAPFIDEVVDFSKLKDFDGEFYLSAYCIEDGKMAIFPKDEIGTEHFHAALAFPFIYSPFKLNGKTYLEGAAKDTLNFQGLYEYRKDKPYAPIESIVVCDILGLEELIGEPRNLYDAWVRSIIVPLVAISKDDIKLFEELHKPNIPAKYGVSEPKLLRIDFKKHMPEAHWPKVMDWSYSNLQLLYDVGYAAGKEFFAENKQDLVAVGLGTSQADRPMNRVAASPAKRTPPSKKVPKGKLA